MFKIFLGLTGKFCIVSMMVLTGCLSRAQYLNEQGIELGQEGQYAEALRKFRMATESDATYAEAHLNLARTYLVMKKPQEALVPARKAAELAPQDVKTQLLLVLTHVLLQDEKSAADVTQELLEVHPDDHQIYVALGDIAAGSKRWGQAIARYQQAIQCYAEWDVAYLQLGRAYLYQELERLQTHRELPVMDMADSQAMMSRMGNWMASGGVEMGQAKACFRKAVYLNPRNVEAHIMLGILAFHRSEYDESEVEWQEALRGDPENTFIHMGLGLNAQQKKQYAQAKQYFVKAQELEPRQLQPLMLQIFLSVAQKEYAKAMEQAVDVMPSFPDLEEELLRALAYDKLNTVPWLIDLVAHPHAKVADLSAKALSYLSKKTYTREKEVWQQWWNAEKARMMEDARREWSVLPGSPLQPPK